MQLLLPLPPAPETPPPSRELRRSPRTRHRITNFSLRTSAGRFLSELRNKTSEKHGKKPVLTGVQFAWARPAIMPFYWLAQSDRIAVWAPHRRAAAQNHQNSRRTRTIPACPRRRSAQYAPRCTSAPGLAPGGGPIAPLPVQSRFPAAKSAAPENKFRSS